MQVVVGVDGARGSEGSFGGGGSASSAWDSVGKSEVVIPAWCWIYLNGLEKQRMGEREMCWPS